MTTVEVDTQELLQTVRENRQTHKERYEEACEKYRTQFAEQARQLASFAESGGLPGTCIDLTKPKKYLGDYDDAIGMLEMHTGETLELGVEEYQKLVNDDWGWKRHFESTTGSYA